MVQVNDNLAIPLSELSFVASRGGGPGGQHVNKVASRVTLKFDVRNSPSLSASQRARLEEKLAGRISRDGILQLSSHSTRSQAANREELVKRFGELLREALRRPRQRRKTRPSGAAKARRKDEKRRRGEVKRRRGRVRGHED